MKLIHGIDQAGTAGKTGSRFTGTVYNYLTMGATDGVTINTVTFTPGARTYWHRHERGQILQVLAGEGLVCTRNDGIRVLKAGDTVWCPPNEIHWHGASSGAFMTHTAISLGVTEWQDEVTPAEYASPLEPGDVR